MSAIVALVLLAPRSGAEPLPGSLPQQMQLNRDAQQELREMQRPPPFPLATPTDADRLMRERLNRKQQIDQQALQEAQRRELMFLRRRAAQVEGPETRLRLEAIDQQRQFRLQQQRQLNRFRNQQGYRLR
jgi:hypothetical protein